MEVTVPQFANPPATVDLPAQRVTRIVSIDAPRSLVWRCCTDADYLVRWLGDIAVFPDGIVEGSAGRIAWTGEVVLAARIDAVEPEERLALQWAEGILSDRASTVDMTFRAQGSGSQVHLVESGFPLEGDTKARREALRAIAAGWTVELDELVDLAESLASRV